MEKERPSRSTMFRNKMKIEKEQRQKDNTVKQNKNLPVHKRRARDEEETR